jgi:nifR3 family TIM-barrel protein
MNLKDIINIKSNIVLAPIAGYTDSPFRKICSQFGAGFTMSELVSAEGIIRQSEKTLAMLKFSDAERPFGIQLFGRDIKAMCKAAVYVESLKPDFIDINMGCPASSVTKGGDGSGAALLLDLPFAAKLAESIVNTVKVPVSIKMRIGWNNELKNCVEAVKVLSKTGISFITIHGRTKTQGYTGNADWDLIGECVLASSIPVIGNGDIVSYAQASEKMKTYGCAGIMIGRGACGNPWIFSGSIPQIDEVTKIIKEHIKSNIEHYGFPKGLILMRKHLVKYIHDVQGASAYRQKLVLAKETEEVFQILDDIEKGLTEK